MFLHCENVTYKCNTSLGEVIYGNHTIDHSALTQDHGVTMSETSIHDGQLLLGDAVSAAAALVGVQDSSGIVSIPVQAAAAMMQIQGTNLIPVSISGAGGVQFIATSSLSNFHLAAHHQHQHQHGPGNDDTSGLTMDVPMHPVNEHQVSDSVSVPAATQAVEVVTLTDHQQSQSQT